MAFKKAPAKKAPAKAPAKGKKPFVPFFAKKNTKKK